MKSRADRDGKSKTASAVDAAHYPEQNEVVMEATGDVDRDEVARLAHELWMKHGRPEGTAERDWYEATEMLRAKANSANALHSSSTSVQR